MNKKELRELIKQLVSDRNSDSPEDRQYMRHLAEMSHRYPESMELWRNEINQELERRKRKKPEYDELITNLITKYNEL